MAQTFYPLTPTEITPTTAMAWIDVDVSAYVPSGATGVILHCVATDAATLTSIGLRKNGSTDERTQVFYFVHNWAAIGVDAGRIFEAYVGHTTFTDIYLVGYTMSGVTFFTNAYDKSLTALSSWTDISAATEAPSAIGLIFEVIELDITWVSNTMGLRMNGSGDTRVSGTIRHHTIGVIIGCDTSQIVEGYIGRASIDFFLIGYITDGATFNTNATDVSLSTTATWLDLAALPANAVMGFIEVTSTAAYKYGLRENGSTEEIYFNAERHPWAFVKCDASYIIEGKIADVAVDFFVVGYATAVAEENVTVTPGVIAQTITSYIPVNGWGIIPSTTALSTSIFNAVTGYGFVPTTNAFTTTQYASVLDMGIIAGLASLSTTNFAPVLQEVLTPTTKELTLSFLGAVTGYGFVPETKALTSTLYASVLKETVTPTTQTLTLSMLDAVTGYGVVPTTGTLTISAFASVLNMGIIPSTATLGATLYIPVLKLAVTPDLNALVLAEYAPSINIGIMIIPSTLALAMTNYVPVLGFEIIPSTTSLATTKYIPVLGLGIVPSTITLATTKFAPVLDWGIIPTIASLTSTEYIPVLQLTVTPDILALILTEYAPNIIIPAGIIVTPETETLLASLFVPSLGFGIVASVVNLIDTEYAPSVYVYKKGSQSIITLYADRSQVQIYPDRSQISSFPDRSQVQTTYTE